MSINQVTKLLNSSSGYVLSYIPSISSNKSASFTIGNEDGQISNELFVKIVQYARYGRFDGSSSFQDVLAEAMYNGFSVEDINIVINPTFS